MSYIYNYIYHAIYIIYLFTPIRIKPIGLHSSYLSDLPLLLKIALEAIIPNFHQNYLRIVLPSAMATITDLVSHTLVFPDLVLPTGGFFSTRLAAQISKAPYESILMEPTTCI